MLKCNGEIFKTENGIITTKIGNQIIIKEITRWPRDVEVKETIEKLAEYQGVKVFHNTVENNDELYRVWWFVEEDIIDPEGRGYDDVDALLELG